MGVVNQIIDLDNSSKPLPYKFTATPCRGSSKPLPYKFTATLCGGSSDTRVCADPYKSSETPYRESSNTRIQMSSPTIPLHHLL